MEWLDLVSTNRYGECAAEDVKAVVGQFIAYARRRGVALEITPSRLVSQILRYILLRQRESPMDISNPLFAPLKPAGWTDHEEQIWLDWIASRCSFKDWMTEVMVPVFGTDTRLWEARCEGWRLELMHFLPWWFQRSMDIVQRYDPTQLEPEEEKEESKIDPYLLDHGSTKQKRGR